MINIMIVSFILSLMLLMPASVLAQTTDFKIIVVSTTVHDLGLEAIQMQNGQIIPTINFEIDPASVVQVQQNDNLMIITSTNEPERIQKVKLTNTQGQVTELISLQNNQYSLSGLNVGVYVLNVIADTDKGKYAYETLLVILAPNQQPIQQTEIIKLISKVKIDIKILFKDNPKDKPSICYFDPNNKACEPKNGICPKGFGFNEDDRCIPIGKCPSGYGRLDDDETGTCFPDKDIKKCPNGYITHKKQECPPEDEPEICLPSFGPPPMCSEEPELICDENTPEGATCKDEGDMDEVEEEEEESTTPLPGFEEDNNSEQGEENSNEGSDGNSGSDEKAEESEQQSGEDSEN